MIKINKTHCIYKHTNKINNKIYIGQALDNKYKERWSNGHGYSKQYFYKDILKYGWDNFSHEILETGLSDNEVDERESFWIAFYNSTDENIGYNRDPGGKTKSLETRQRMKESWQKDSFRKEKQSILMTELNKQIDRTGKNNPMYGKDRTGDKAGRKRKVKCVETQEIFCNITGAGKWSNNGKTSTNSHISSVCKGKRKTSGQHPITKEPLHWVYVDE